MILFLERSWWSFVTCVARQKMFLDECQWKSDANLSINILMDVLVGIQEEGVNKMMYLSNKLFLLCCHGILIDYDIFRSDRLLIFAKMTNTLFLFII